MVASSHKGKKDTSITVSGSPCHLATAWQMGLGLEGWPGRESTIGKARAPRDKDSGLCFPVPPLTAHWRDFSSSWVVLWGLGDSSLWPGSRRLLFCELGGGVLIDIKASCLRHHCHFGLDNSLWWGCLMPCGVISSTPGHSPLQAGSSPSPELWRPRKLGALWGCSHPWLRATALTESL